MKQVMKGGEPQEFTDWKALTNGNWQPTYDDLHGDTKKAVKTALMDEQGHICCYCERRLENNDSHIEHFQPQKDPAVDALDFSNMLCSCQDQVEKGEPLHCGNKKGGWFDSTLLVSPLDPDCETRFSFEGDGLITPVNSGDGAATETISRLALNIPKLNALRESAISPFLDEDLSPSDIKRFVAGYLEKDSEGMFGEFWTTINYMFGAIL